MNLEVVGKFGGVDVDRVAIRSADGASAQVLSWGAALADLAVPCRSTVRHVVLGLRTLDDYVQFSLHMGAIAGRFANRIRGGEFKLDGATYELPRNFLGRHCLHGGSEGFGKRTWQLADVSGDAVALTLNSPDGDAGFPGNVSVTCEYRLLKGPILRISLGAIADRPTPINLAPHAYFNFDGEPTIDGHSLQIEADFYMPVDEDRVTTGEGCRVQRTAYDFRTLREVSQREPDGELFSYDINFCLREWSRGGMAKASTLRSSRSGLTMELWTDQPGLQFYDGHNVNIPVPGIGGFAYGPRSGLCLEPQFFPNSPNVPHFPDCILRPGRRYQSVTDCAFQPEADAGWRTRTKIRHCIAMQNWATLLV